MDWGYKAALTGMTVAAVMMAARLLGRQVAGLMAGLPVISAPALVWLAAEQGADSAAHSAVGGLAACAAAPVFALAFARAARRHGAAGALAIVHPLQVHPPLVLALVSAAVPSCTCSGPAGLATCSASWRATCRGWRPRRCSCSPSRCWRRSSASG